MTLRVIFAGTPEFARPCLERLVEADCEVVAVMTQPDRRQGRGRRVLPPPVKSFALQHDLPVIQPHRLDDDAVHQLLVIDPDLIIVVAFGLIIPDELLYRPPLGCVNVHASLLPRWRGAAPVARAIEAGDVETGITIMQMDSGLDTGGILSQVAVEIAADDTTATLGGKLALAGATELLRALPAISDRKLHAVEQNSNLATYAHKMTKSDATIDWNECAAAIVCKIRACDPWPVAHSWLNDTRIRIWEAQVCDGDHHDMRPGTVVPSGPNEVIVAAGRGAVRLDSVQRDGKKRMTIRNFIAGNPIAAGSVFMSRAMNLPSGCKRS